MAWNISQIFRPTQQVSSPQGQQMPQGGQQQQQPTPGSSMQVRNDPTGGGNNQPGGNNSQEPSSPLDNFKDAWKTPDPGKGQPPADPFSQPLFQTDPAKIREAASQMDFMQGVPQELMQKVMAGGDPQALMQLMNYVGQQALATSLHLSTATIEQAGTKIGSRFQEALPGRFKDFQLNSSKPSNPVLEHPAAAPMLKMAKQQFRMSNPDASAEDINAMAENYVMTFAKAIVGDGNSGSQNQGAGENQQDFNWMEWAQSSPKT